MQSIVRDARLPHDAAAIARVHADSWRATYGAGLLPASYLATLTAPRLTPSWQDKLARRGRPGNRVWVAETDGRIAGFVEAGPCHGGPGRDALAGFAGEVYMLYVHPDQLGIGLGRALIDRARQHLAALPLFWLVIWVVEGNAPARRFYHRMGLRPDGGRRTDRFADVDVPVIRYAVPLNLAWAPPQP